MITMTVLDLLTEKLPYKYVVAIIRNMKSDDKYILDEQSVGSILEEIETLFDWEESFEGYLFWADVFDSIANGAALPELPFRTRWQPDTYLCLDDGSYILNFRDSGSNLTIELNTSEKPKNIESRYFLEQHLAFCN